MHRYRPTTVALSKIRRFKKRKDVLIRWQPVLQELLYNWLTRLNFVREILIRALQGFAIDFNVLLPAMCTSNSSLWYYCTVERRFNLDLRHVVLMPKDIHLARRIRGEKV